MDYKDLGPQKGMFSLAIKWMLFILALIAIFYFLVLPFFVGGRLIDRQAKKFDAETSAQVYDSSRQYQQGTNRDLARYCRQWRDADGAGKVAVAELIRSTHDTYQGPLTPENERCLQEIN